MQRPPHSAWRRVEGARALARAFVLSAETITRVRFLSQPGYRRLTVADLNGRIGQIHDLCRRWQSELEEDTQDMPQSAQPDGRDKYAPMKNRFWTAQGDNGSDPPVNVGIFGQEVEAKVWCKRQNETQRMQEWGRGQAGPMTFTPKPLYHQGSGAGAPDPRVPVFPERMWDKADADQE